jgi:hypothetical protein
MVIDALTVLLGLFTYGLEAVLIGLFSVATSSYVINMILTFGAQSCKSVQIISDQYIQIMERVHDELDRGSTLLDATGGYTGAWGPEGKLAWLHEKELILNARDTENFLTATGILRDISKAIDLSSLQSQSAWLQAVGMTKSEQQTLEQMVSIEAHFPNVTDRNEIEEAFNNLINTASQYANRKF